jgi:ArsR family transcriptional regulator
MVSLAPASSASTRVELYRLLADEDRLQILALTHEAELSVGELAELLGESQPQITKKTQPLRDAGLLLARRDGTRTLLEGAPPTDAVVSDALEEGRRLARRAGSLGRVAAVVRRREESSRRFFEQVTRPSDAPPPRDADLSWLEAFAPLLASNHLAVDAGTGEGALLPILARLYQRVIAVDRSAARLARCAERVAAQDLANVRLHEGDAADAVLYEDVTRAGGADLVVASRVLHHAARPAESVRALARLVRRGGALLVVDYEPHTDEALRETLGDVWLGFPRAALEGWFQQAGLDAIRTLPLAARAPAGEPDHPLPLHAVLGVRR